MAGLDLTINAGEFYGVSPAMLDGDGLGEVQAVLWEIVYSWREVLQDAWPRDTGVSFQSWTSRVRGLVIELFNPVEYAEWVHAAGEDEGAAGEYMRETRDRLMAEATADVQAAVQASQQRQSSGFATPAQEAGIRPQTERFGGGIRAAVERAFAARGARLRQRAVFAGQRLGQAGAREVIQTREPVLIRFRERLRTRERVR